MGVHQKHIYKKHKYTQVTHSLSFLLGWVELKNTF